MSPRSSLPANLADVPPRPVVRVKLDNDGKSLPTKSVTVSIRCYESRLGRVSVLQSNILVDQTQVLWSKPDSQEYADLGDAEFPFRLTLPPNVAGFSTATFVEYKCTWRVEASKDPFARDEYMLLKACVSDTSCTHNGRWGEASEAFGITPYSV